MSEGETLLNAVIGAAVAVVLAFLPFSTVLGGAVAGYLQGGDRNAGAKAGGLAGLFAGFLLAIGVVFFVGLFAAVPVGRSALALILVMGFAVVFVALGYGVLAGIVGGYLGAYVREELREERAGRPDARDAGTGTEPERP